MVPSVRLAIAPLLRASRSNVSHPIPQRKLYSCRTANIPVAQPFHGQVRWQSQGSAVGDGSSNTYTFDDITELVSRRSKDHILIDTREPSELHNTGRIPGALNIPITSQPDSFFISEEEFEDRFGFARPPKDKEVIFYCKSGVRSRAAAQLAKQGGWEKTGEYTGSWLDWAGKGGTVER